MYPDHWDDYCWIVVVGALAAFFMACGIGANDVANAFGTSVGAKTITLRQACVIAAIFEFAGCVGLGGEVTKTIAGSIARPAAFQAEPEIFMYGMMCALISAGMWLAVATYNCLAVSTTHSIIGAVMGFALVWGGGGAVVWNDRKKEFPYSSGFVPVVCSWFVSPIMSGIASSILFFLNRFIVLRRPNSTTLAIYVFPLLVFITIFVNLFFVISKGASKVAAWPSNKAAWVAACVAGGLFLLSCFPGIPLLRRRVRSDMERAEQKVIDAEAAAAKAAAAKLDPESGASADGSSDPPEPVPSAAKRMFDSFKKAATHGLNQDIHDHVEKHADVAAMHAAAEVFDPETEQVYKYLQVFSACAVSFAHGANDVANAIGPFAGIWYVYRNWTISSNGEVPIWLLVLGGAGIVLGLALYGYKVMKTLGVGLAKMTPCRGYCAEISTALTISVASVYGMPVSSTQIITGAELGVGLVESLKTGVNYRLLAKQFVGWVFTLIVAGFLCAAIFAYGVYAPSLTMSKDVAVYENGIRSVSEAFYKSLNASNRALNVSFPGVFDASLDAKISGAMSNFKSKFDTKKIGYIDPYGLINDLNASAMTYVNQSVMTVGYNPKTRAVLPVGATDFAATNVEVSPYAVVDLKRK